MNHAIVACARGWLGTRFHHQGRIKRTATHMGGVDCLGLLAGIAVELKLIGPDGMALALSDEINYPHQPDTRRLKIKLSQLLGSISSDSIMPGDVLLLRVDNSPQHLAIVSNMPNSLGIIHAYAPARAVVEHLLDDLWRTRIEAAFRII